MNLEYDVSYHLHCRLTLNSGRRIILGELHQHKSGLIEGVPFKEFNDRIVTATLGRASKYCVSGTHPYLVPPERRDFLRAPGDMQGVRAMGDRAPEWLPIVTCIAVFTSSGPVRDPDMWMSQLTVAWFQDEFAMPIAEPVLSHLRTIDWERLATDTEM